MKNIKNLVTFQNKLILGLIVGATVWVATTASTYAATLTVTSLSDTVAVNSSCSLPEAIGNINDQATTNSDCVAGNGANDTIVLPSGTIALTSDLPPLTLPANITGQGRSQSIIDGDSNNNYGGIGAFTNSAVVNANVEISNFTVKNSSFCIYTLTSGAGLINYNYSVSNIDLIECGIGLYIGTATGDVGLNAVITDVNISGSTYSQVGIYSIDTSNYTLNRVSISGIGIGLYIWHTASNAYESSISNTTITNTSIPFLLSSDGGVAAQISVGFFNNTFVNNESLSDGSGIVYGISDDTTLTITLQNNLLANNTLNGSLANCSEVGTGVVNIISLGNNMSDDECNGNFGVNDFPNTTNLAATLGALTDNGGTVLTMALLEGSPAINAGATINTLTTDARGFARPSGSSYDIGAFEFQVEDTDDSVVDTIPQVVALANTGSDVQRYIVVAFASILLATIILYAKTRQQSL